MTSNNAEQSAKFPLFYKNPMPLDAQRHVNMALKKDFGLGFTKEVNAVPINLIEMPQVCHFYPIAFSPDGKATPVALLGIRDKENLYVNDNSEWAQNTYIPAYIRRYPFIFSELPDDERLTLCIDNSEEVMEEDGEQKLFDTDGKPSELSKNALEFCKSYHAAAQQTQEFSSAIAASGILVDRQAEIQIKDGKKIKFSGFQIIDEKKLNELDNDTFIEWRKKGWLPFIYAQLFSGSQWQKLTSLLNDRL